MAQQNQTHGYVFETKWPDQPASKWQRGCRVFLASKDAAQAAAEWMEIVLDNGETIETRIIKINLPPS